MVDLLKIIPPPHTPSLPPTKIFLNELLYAPLIPKIIWEFPLRSIKWPPCLQDSENKDMALCDVNEPAVSASGMPCKPRQAISCQNLSDAFCHIAISLNCFHHTKDNKEKQKIIHFHEVVFTSLEVPGQAGVSLPLQM